MLQNIGLHTGSAPKPATLAVLCHFRLASPFPVSYLSITKQKEERWTFCSLHITPPPFPSASPHLFLVKVAQTVKNPPAMQDTWVWFLGWEDPLKKGKATHSSIVAWRIPWTIHGVAKSQTTIEQLSQGSKGLKFKSWINHVLAVKLWGRCLNTLSPFPVPKMAKRETGLQQVLSLALSTQGNCQRLKALWLLLWCSSEDSERRAAPQRAGLWLPSSCG